MDLVTIAELDALYGIHPAPEDDHPASEGTAEAPGLNETPAGPDAPTAREVPPVEAPDPEDTDARAR